MRYRREDLLFITMIAMLAALFVSRAILSITMIAFLAVSFFHRGFITQLRAFFSTPFLYGMTLLFLFPLLSGLWTNDLETWRQGLLVKLPLFLFPIAFAGPLYLRNTRWNWIGYIFLALLTAASGWTLIQYLRETSVINDWYLQARTMVTPLQNDHVRFSWLVSVGVLLSAFFLKRYWSKDRGLAMLFAIMLTWFIVFLHILAARTGLLALYIMMAVSGLWMITRKWKWWKGLILLMMILLLPLAAYQLLPSFRNRVNYVRYEMNYFRNANYLPGSNDAVRVISMEAGWEIMQDNPLSGVGYGDVTAAIQTWYQRTRPEMKDSDRILPSNQWLIYGAGLGIPGFIVFCLCMTLPFLVRVKHMLPWILLNIVAAAGFLFDIGLEVQFGVFVYCFTVLWWFSWLKRTES